ncbi:MAG TPA: hypothetical protein VNA69_13155 [Thermoanaerobaculia bacterium]|nr:hypothetical protein [Thermoanaerobaculia bacterium]
MKKTTFAIAAVAVIALAVGSSLTAVKTFSHDHPRFHTSWKDTFEKPGQLIRGVEAIVVARHVGTSPGRVAFSDNPEDAVPFELNHFIVEKGLKGLPSGSSFTLERVGGRVHNEVVVLDSDGGPYVPGERYTLFMNRQPESSFFYLVNDEGRYTVDESDRLVPVAQQGKVAGALAGLEINDLVRSVSDELRVRVTR